LDQVDGSITAVDVGTGCGNIALSLATHAKANLVIGIDRSKASLKVARSNQGLIKTGAPIRWIQGDLLHPLMQNHGQAGLIVANLPYVRTQALLDLEPELKWEPRMALDGGKDGLQLIGPCIRQSPDVLSAGGVLLLEIGFDQSTEVMALFKKDGRWEDIRIFNDLSGLPRIAQARKRGN
jgi:release factor glutamine methyltransferase